MLLVLVLERVQFWPVRVESGYQLKIRAGYETGTGNIALTRSVFTMYNYTYYTTIRTVNASLIMFLSNSLLQCDTVAFARPCCYWSLDNKKESLLNRAKQIHICYNFSNIYIYVVTKTDMTR